MNDGYKMSRAPATFKQSDLVRMIAAAKRSGLPIARVEFEGGKITLFVGEPTALNDDKPNSWLVDLDKLQAQLTTTTRRRRKCAD
jgi:hypothetical protein